MTKYCFVILHYKTLSETYQCVQYIKGLSNQHNIQIIIVDNGSKDNSIQELKNQIEDESNILYVESEYNLGFARGNNLGYTIAKHKYKAQYVIMLNSDVYIQQNEFPELVDEIYQKTYFDILGPDIVTEQGLHQNPVDYINDSLERVNKTIFRNRIRYLITFLPISVKEFFKNIAGSDDIKEKTILYKEKNLIENCPLHGACLIFSEKFIKDHEFPFYPDTFLYGEEDILYYLGQKNHEKFIFSSILKVIHVEDAATDISFSNQRKKRRFVIKNSNQSLKILKKLMKSKELL